MLPRPPSSGSSSRSADFTALLEASSPANQPAPSPLPTLPRELILATHQQALDREAALDRAGEVRTRKVVVGPGKHFASGRRMEELERVQLGAGSRLRCGEVGRGKLLPCRVVTRLVRAVAVQYVIEDERGNVAPVHVYHLPARLELEDLNALYPLGATFAIREPSIRESRDGFLIRIDSPSDLVRLYPSSPLLRDISWSTISPLPSLNRTAAQYKDQGNRLFAQRKWLRALEDYSLGLDLEGDGGGKLSSVLRANKAVTELKLHRPGAALQNCEAALVDPSLDDPSSAGLKQKVLFRAATAEYQLQHFESASSHLSQILDLYPDDLDAMDLYRRTQVRLVEASRGEYDWPYLFEASRTAQVLDVADYTGSMIAPAEIPGHGRGLVATRDIIPGELLLVARPFAMGRGEPSRKSFVVGMNLFTETMDPYAHYDLIALLLERIVDEPALYDRLCSLYPGTSFPSPPPPPRSSPPSLDTSRLESIATFNSFHTESLSQKTATLSPADERAANIHAPSSLYDVPSLLNHACVGNVTYSFLASTIFFRARRAILKGEELLDSYADSLEGLEARRDKLDKHGFVCTCELCEADLKDGFENRKEREKISHEVEELTDWIHGEKQDPSRHLGAMREYVLRLKGTYDASRSALRPAMYAALRLLAQSLASGGEEEEAILVEVRALESLGAVFRRGGEGREWECVEVPRVGDVNAVLSSLFIAKQLQTLGRKEASVRWIATARRIEAGQAGEALFSVRYAEWAERNGLDLRADLGSEN